MNNILSKTDPDHIQRLTQRCNIFNDVHFDAFLKSVYVPLYFFIAVKRRLNIIMMVPTSSSGA